MSIYISASLLNDYIACNRKVYYRTKHSELAVQNEEMVMGEIVHYAIEKYWNDEVGGRDYIAKDVSTRLPGNKSATDFSLNCFSVFNDRFRQYLTTDDQIEFKFKIQIDNGVFVVGKMDRVSSKKVFDWKTERKPPVSINNSIQFILYNWAYKKTFGYFPMGVYYASLISGNLIRYNVNELSEKTLFSDIIPDAINDIKKGNYSRNGVFRKACFRCSYSDTCLKEFDVLDNSASIEK